MEWIVGGLIVWGILAACGSAGGIENDPYRK